MRLGDSQTLACLSRRIGLNHKFSSEFSCIQIKLLKVSYTFWPEVHLLWFFADLLHVQNVAQQAVVQNKAKYHGGKCTICTIQVHTGLQQIHVVSTRWNVVRLFCYLSSKLSATKSKNGTWVYGARRRACAKVVQRRTVARQRYARSSVIAHERMAWLGSWLPAVTTIIQSRWWRLNGLTRYTSSFPGLSLLTPLAHLRQIQINQNTVEQQVGIRCFLLQDQRNSATT